MPSKMLTFSDFAKKILTLMMLTFIYLHGFSQERERTIGIIKNSEEAFEGYTLYAPHADTKAYLIDNCGDKVHSWESNYFPGNAVYLTEDGSLYKAGKTSDTVINAGGAGGIIEKFSWEGELLWSFTYSNNSHRHHHDFQVLDNGNVLVLAWGRRTFEEAIAMGRDSASMEEGELWPEHIVEVKPVGNTGGQIVWKWDSWDHLIQDRDENKPNYGVVSDHPEKININYHGDNSADWHHANSLNYNPELDQIAISIHSFDEFWIIDHNTTTEEAAGPKGDLLYRWGNPATYDSGTEEDQQLFGQHTVHWIPPGLPDAGLMLVFNNGRDRKPDLYTSVVKINTMFDANDGYQLSGDGTFLPETFDWEYTAPTPTDFYSRFISGAQQLPNGNILIDNGAAGTFFEINEADEVVWKYVNPLTPTGLLAHGDDVLNNVVFRATRYPLDYPAFDGRTIESQGPIEEDIIEFDCGDELLKIDGTQQVSFYPNPAKDQLIIESYQKPLSYTLTDLYGRMISKGTVESKVNIDIRHLKNGIYLLKFNDGETHRIIIGKR
ncbi:MAG: aryl-sulfate sulfotransferase [Cyclobacteriaceae bacterium]